MHSNMFILEDDYAYDIPFHPKNKARTKVGLKNKQKVDRKEMERKHAKKYYDKNKEAICAKKREQYRLKKEEKE